MTFVIRRFHALFLRPFSSQSDSCDVKTEPSLASLAKRRVWPPPASQIPRRAGKTGETQIVETAAPPPAIEATLRSRVEGVPDTLRAGRAPVAPYIPDLEEEAETLDRDNSETGPTPAVEVGRVRGGPWEDDESAVRVESQRPPSTSRTAASSSRIYRVPRSKRPPSSAHMRAARNPLSDTQETAQSFDFPDHSTASGALWPDDEECAAISCRSGVPTPTLTSQRPVSPRSPRIFVHERPLALTGELPVLSAADLER